MDINQKWINDKKAKLNGEIMGLRRRIEQLQNELQQTSAAILIKQGELQAVIEVEQELHKPVEKAEKKEKVRK